MLACSASIKDRQLFLTVTNSHAQQAAEITVNLLGGARAAAASVQVLSGEIHAHNTFDAPTQITPQPLAAAISGAVLTLTLPPAAVAAVQITLD